jgi:hypothetical protein
MEGFGASAASASRVDCHFAKARQSEWLAQLSRTAQTIVLFEEAE